MWFARGNQQQLRVNNDEIMKFLDFHPTKMAITPQLQIQASNYPIITHIIFGC